jgi:hypothetical protein
MKNCTLLVLFLSLYFAAKAQTYAIINDKDGFVNIRKDKNLSSPIVGKIYNDKVFSYDEEDLDKSGWVRIYKQDFDHNGMEGYIHKSRILSLSKFKTIKKIKFYKDSCMAINDSLTIVIKSKLFNPRFHKLTYSKPLDKHSQGILIRIDSRHIWGTDGELPKKMISSLTLIKNGIPIIIPKIAINDLYEPNFKSFKIYLSPNDVIYIEMDNSDGAGAYSIIWTIKNGKYLERYIDNSNV